MQLEIKSKIEKGIGVIELKGVLDISTVKSFQDSLSSLKNLQEITIDFENLSFIDSTGVGSLNQVIKKLHNDKIKVKVKNISKDIYEIFEILGLPEIFGEELFEEK